MLARMCERAVVDRHDATLRGPMLCLPRACGMGGSWSMVIKIDRSYDRRTFLKLAGATAAIAACGGAATAPSPTAATAAASAAATAKPVTGTLSVYSARSEERRVGKRVDRGGRRSIKKKTHKSK